MGVANGGIYHQAESKKNGEYCHKKVIISSIFGQRLVAQNRRFTLEFLKLNICKAFQQQTQNGEKHQIKIGSDL